MLSMGVLAYADGPAVSSCDSIAYSEEYCSGSEVGAALTRVNYLKSGSKTQRLFNEGGDVLIIVKVNGTFKYNGTTATATLASYEYEIVSGSWYFVEGTAYCDGNSAIAELEFKHPLLGTVYSIVTLSCTPNGTLS